MRSWYEIYRERMNSAYLNHVATKYAPFIKALYDTRLRHFTEVGCGAGNITRILREMHLDGGHQYHLLDSCPKMLSLAVENNPHPNCTFQVADLTSARLPQVRYSVIHSHGLLEHFSDEQIRHIVDRCAYAAPVQIHYVPGIGYGTPSRGDERLLHRSHWKEILHGLGKTSVTTFNSDLDFILRIER